MGPLLQHRPPITTFNCVSHKKHLHYHDVLLRNNNLFLKCTQWKKMLSISTCNSRLSSMHILLQEIFQNELQHHHWVSSCPRCPYLRHNYRKHIQLHHWKEVMYKVHHPKPMFILAYGSIALCICQDPKTFKQN
jgi:hypothetical protein